MIQTPVWVYHMRRYDGSGFTLIELLVVIAIIATISAILFPVFATAKRVAKTTVCATNIEESVRPVIKRSATTPPAQNRASLRE